MPTQANAEHDLQHQQDTTQRTYEAPNLDHLIPKKQEKGARQTQAQQNATIGEELSMTKRLSIAGHLRQRLNSAHAVFIDVANQVYAEIKAKKAADAALVSSLINIAFVWIAPGVSKGIEKLAVLLDKNSKKHAAFVAAYQLLDKSDKIAASVLGIPKDQLLRYVTTTKTAANTHQGFIKGMKTGFRLAIDQISSMLTDSIEKRNVLPDAELIAITAKWDPNILTDDVLKAKVMEQVNMWEKTVAPIGEETYVRGSNALQENKVVGLKVKGVVWAFHGYHSYLCLVEAETGSGGQPQYRFLRFIPEDMKEMAINKAEAQAHQTSGIRHIEPKDIKDYPTTKIPTNTAKG